MSSTTTADLESDLGFAPEADRPIPYMQRTRDWYGTLGFGAPYRWAHYTDVPFLPLAKPLSECTLTLITTAAPYQPDKGNQGPGAAYNASAKFFNVYSMDTAQEHDVRISHVGIDRKHTSMEDSGCWFPLPALRDAVSAGRVGKLAARFHGAPTNRSQRHTLEIDCPEILKRCREDGVDVAVLVPNCPVCHQTLCLVARYLEANGIATVVMGCAKDIVEHAGVPRFLFSDFPLGNGAGRPHDKPSQAKTLEMGLCVLESAVMARSTVQSPLRWSDDWTWKLDFLNIEQLSAEEIARQRAETQRAMAVAKQVKAADTQGQTA